MPENRSRYVLLCQQLLAFGTVAALAASALGVVSLEIVAPVPQTGGQAAVPTTAALVASEPVEPEVTEAPVTDVASHRDHRGQDLAALSAPQDVDGVATVGVTWNRGADVDEDEITVSVRSRDDGDWGDWQSIEYHDDHGPTPGSAEARGARPGTEPIVVGQVDQVQVKIETADGEAPAGARVAVVDPGRPEAVSLEQPAIDTAELPSEDALALSSQTIAPAADPAEPVTDPVVDEGTGDGVLAGTVAVTPKPRIFSRAQWGADERLRDRSSLSYHEIHAGFVHHTVNANNYTRAQVPSLLRGIYAYHTQSKGWSDIGYNFVVDRFGRIWEGRYGGVSRPVVGAHTLGYNEYAFAMSALGNFDTARPSDAMIDAYGRLFAWKLSLHGVSASSSKQWVGSRYFPAVNGHRDAGSTACPGRYLYAKLGDIRARASANQRPFTSRTRSTNIAGSPWPDLVVRHKATQRAYVIRTGGQTNFERPTRATSGWKGMDLLAASRDLTGDGVPDMVARTGANKMTGVFAGTAQGGIGAQVSSTRRFKWADQLAGVADLGGDRYNDVVARMSVSKQLFLFPGNGDRGFRPRIELAENWGNYNLTSGAGDLTGDGRPELLVRAAGRLSYVPMASRRALGTPVRMAGSWGRFSVITGGGDLTGDGHHDVVAQERRSKRVYIYPGNGGGRLGQPLGPFTQFGTLNYLGVWGDAAGGPSIDLVGRADGGGVFVFPHNGRRNLEGVVGAGVGLAGTNLMLNVGDWNRDGYGDIMTRVARTGDLLLRPGNGAGGFGAPVLAARGWGSVRLAAAVGDLTGDGYPDLMGQPQGMAMRIYPGNGSSGFLSSFVARSAIDANLQTGLGLWDADGSPDSLMRLRDGTLQLYRGNGPGGLLSPRKAGSGTGGYNWLHAVGDATGDGRSDLVAREAATGILWLLPGVASGFGQRRFIAAGFGGYDLSG